MATQEIHDLAELGPLGALVTEPSQSAVLTDFDGTLAPIVPDPMDAKPLPGAASVLGRLATRFKIVGVVSGRPAAFLAHHLAASGRGVRLVGVYGFEWIENGEVRRAAEVERWIGPAGSVLAAARASAPQGLGIEDKGASVTLHWRGAPEIGPWAWAFAEEWSAKTGMVLQPGRMAVEFRPPVDIDKGRVVERLADGCTAVCFAGDDAGDLAAFEALDRLASRGVATVRIAVSDEESPPELAASADLVVSGPSRALDLLRTLAEAVGA